jgi:hypothetical protein
LPEAVAIVSIVNKIWATVPFFFAPRLFFLRRHKALDHVQYLGHVGPGGGSLGQLASHFKEDDVGRFDHSPKTLNVGLN